MLIHGSEATRTETRNRRLFGGLKEMFFIFIYMYCVWKLLEEDKLEASGNSAQDSQPQPSSVQKVSIIRRLNTRTASQSNSMDWSIRLHYTW